MKKENKELNDSPHRNSISNISNRDFDESGIYEKLIKHTTDDIIQIDLNEENKYSQFLREKEIKSTSIKTNLNQKNFPLKIEIQKNKENKKNFDSQFKNINSPENMNRHNKDNENRDNNLKNIKDSKKSKDIVDKPGFFKLYFRILKLSMTYKSLFFFANVSVIILAFTQSSIPFFHDFTNFI